MLAVAVAGGRGVHACMHVSVIQEQQAFFKEQKGKCSLLKWECF